MALHSPRWAKASFFWDFIPKVSWSVSVHSVVSDRLTDRTRFCSIPMRLPEPSGRQSGDLGEKWPLEFCLRTLRVLFMPEGSFTCRKSTTWDRRLYFPSEGSGASGQTLKRQKECLWLSKYFYEEVPTDPLNGTIVKYLVKYHRIAVNTRILSPERGW
jgi:hypothetical protein